MDGSVRPGESEDKGSLKFWQYAKKAFLQSTIAGIPQIVAAENIPKKLIRTLVFVSCLVGFTYQFMTFLFLYWKYPIIMDVQVTSPPDVDVPAFTVCDHNGLSLMKYCSEYPCYNPTGERKRICKTLKRYCRRGLVVDTIRLPENHKTTLEVIRTSKINRDLLRPDLNEKINSCEMLNARREPKTECDDPIETPLTNGFLPTTTDCHSYNVLWNQPGEEPAKISSAASINLILRIDARDYLPTIPETYVSQYVEFHNPYAKVNPFLTGYNMFKGRGYKFFFKQRVLKLLPPPYSTNCMDYMEAWEKNGGRGPTTQHECIEECRMRIEYEELGCNSYYIWYPTDNKRCPSGCANETCPEGIPVNPKHQEYTDKCSEKCRPSCLYYRHLTIVSKDRMSFETMIRQKEYDVNGEEMQVPEEVFSHIRDWRTWKNYIYIRASFDKHEITTYTYSPKFEVIETFSYLGGYIGMWLGISLIAMFDFTETTAAVVKYQWKRMKGNDGRKNINRPHVHSTEEY